MTKRIAVGVMATVMLASGLITSCGKKEIQTGSQVEVNGSAVYPVQCDDTLSYWVSLHPRLEGSFSNFGDTPLGIELEKRTGVKIEYVHPQAGQEGEQFNIMLASNDLPDIVTSNWASYTGGPEQAIKDGYIYNLNDLIDKYAPALKDYLAKHPKVDNKIRTDEGNYYAFPFVRGEEWMGCCNGLIIRKDWLDKLEMEEPKTIDELGEVLRGFKRLGAKSPLAVTTGDLAIFLYAYGTAPDFYVENGKVKYGYATDNYKKAVGKIAEWYNEGLIDNNLVTVDSEYINARMLNSESGAFRGLVVGGIGTMLDAKPNDEFQLMAIQQPTENGEKPEFSYMEHSC